jgi:formate C-acetyltransferase
MVYDSEVKASIENLREEAWEFYNTLLPEYASGKPWRHPIEDLCDEYDRIHPGLNAYELKAAQYEIIAEHFTPHVFDNAPFWFANNIGLKDGAPNRNAGGWLFKRNQHIYRDADPDAFFKFNAWMAKKIHLCCGPYVDSIHYTYPSIIVVSKGFKAFYEEAEAAMPFCQNDDERSFLRAAMRGLFALKRISERFAEAAENRLKFVDDPAKRRNLRIVAGAARYSPWEKPSHFLEGLNALWFCREICGFIEGIGNSHLGRHDYALYDLYRKDIESGYLTEEDAYELVKMFIVLGDSHYDKNETVVGYSDHELEMGFVLGGCDERGEPVWNEVTRMFLRAHREVRAIYPKLHLRFSSISPEGYLEEISRDFLAGRSVASLINDDSVIPALVNMGVTPEDARCYTNCGCWGIALEGMDSVSGGNYYHLITILDLSTRAGSGDIGKEEYEKLDIHIEPFEGALNFEDLYRRFFGNLIRPLRQRCRWIGKYGKLAPKVNPLPIFSSCLTDCIKNRKDFTAGGARYNFNEIDPAEFANAVDALLAIKILCFDRKEVNLDEYLRAVRNNWEGCERLLAKARKCPHFGDESAESVSLSRRLYDDIYANTRDLVNERGGPFQMNFYVYREFKLDAENMCATTDGRKRGDFYAMGICPTRFHREDSMPAMVNSIAALDMNKSVLQSITIQLPIGKMSSGIFTSMLRAFAANKLKHIQINCVNPAELQDARAHPENHQDLVVRICGFSAKFVSLSPEWQEEFMSRYIYQTA